MKAKKKQVRAGSVERKRLAVKIEPFGPTPAAIGALAQRLVKHPKVRKTLGEARQRLLYIDVLDADDDAKRDKPKPPERFRATFFDYTNTRTVFATGSLARPTPLELSESGLEPRPSRGEFAEAVQALREDGEIGPALREGRLVPYHRCRRSLAWNCQMAAPSERSRSACCPARAWRAMRSSACERPRVKSSATELPHAAARSGYELGHGMVVANDDDLFRFMLEQVEHPAEVPRCLRGADRPHDRLRIELYGAGDQII